MTCPTCSRCGEAPAVTRTGPLLGLCLGCLENDALGSAAELATLRARMEAAERDAAEAHAIIDMIDCAVTGGELTDFEMSFSAVRRAVDACNERDAALSEVARLTRERDEARGEIADCMALLGMGDHTSVEEGIEALRNSLIDAEAERDALAAKGGAT